MGRSRRLAIDEGTEWAGHLFFDNEDLSIVNSGPGYNDYLVISPSSSDFNNVLDDPTVHLAEPLYTDFNSAQSSFVVWGAGIISFGPPDPLQVAFMEAVTGNPDAEVDLSGFPGTHISLGLQIDPFQIEIGFRDPDIVGAENAYTLIGFGPRSGITASVLIYADHVVVTGSVPGAEITLDGNHVIPLTDGTFDLRPLIVVEASPGSSVINGGNAPETINGTTGADTINEGTGAAIINAGDGADIVNVNVGALGATDVDGGAGRDTVVIDYRSTGASLNLTLPDSGTVKVGRTSLTVTNVEQIDIFGGSGNDVLTGNALDNRLDGGAGADNIYGGAGNDVLVSAPVPSDPNPPQTAYSTDSANPVNLDHSFGSGANSPYVDLIIPSHPAYDTVHYTFTATAGSRLDITDITDYFDSDYQIDVEVVTPSGEKYYEYRNFGGGLGLDITETGTFTLNIFSADLISPNYVLEFALSCATPIVPVVQFDTLDGGKGDDTFYVNDPKTVVIERPGEGNDTIIVPFDYSLAGTQVENLTLTGTTAVNATGNAANNILTGNAIANVLTGAAGDDTYIVNNTDDRVVELAGQGYDTVRSTVSYALSGPMYPSGTSVEALVLTGTAAINATGNALNNTLQGNSAANKLDGSLGADTMIGGAGDDIYIVDNAGDKVIEYKGQGYDSVFSAVSYALSGAMYPTGTNIERLVLSGTAAINATGNALNNALQGNSAANKLDGSLGADTMIGGAGDDIYIVDNVGDKVIEKSGEGYDSVFSTVSNSLAGTAADRLVLSGSTATNASGNELANKLTGNGAANVLDGGAGIDALIGGAGADTFRFSVAPGTANADTITDFVSGTDKIALAAGVFTGLATGALAPSAFHAGSAAASATDHVIYDSATGKIWWDVDGLGGAAQQLIATLTPGAALVAGDFLIA